MQKSAPMLKYQQGGYFLCSPCMYNLVCAVSFCLWRVCLRAWWTVTVRHHLRSIIACSWFLGPPCRLCTVATILFQHIVFMW